MITSANLYKTFLIGLIKNNMFKWNVHVVEKRVQILINIIIEESVYTQFLD